MGWNFDWIELQPPHIPTDKVRLSYNKAQHLKGRTEIIMQIYADWLDQEYKPAREAV
jgi:hypothetical protein